MPVELDADERVQLGIDGREALGELLTWVTARRQFVSASAISSPA